MKTNTHTHAPAIIIDGDIIQVTPHAEHEYTVTTALAAFGYGVAESSVREMKRQHKDELTEGKHFISVRNPDANPRAGIPHVSTLWTKRGLIRLGFFIKSERAKRFRDMAEDLVLDAWNREATDLSALAPALGALAESLTRVVAMQDRLVTSVVNHESRIAALEDAARTARRRAEPGEDEIDEDAVAAVIAALQKPKRERRQRHAVSLEERRMLAAHRIAEALLARRGRSFNVTFQEIVRIGRELGLDDFQFSAFSDRFPEKGTRSMQSSLGKLVNRLLNGQTFVVNGREWSFAKSHRARGSVYRAILEN